MAAPGKNTAVLDSVTAPLRRRLAEPGVTELVVNRPGEIGIERRGGWTWEDEPALDFANLMALATAAAAFTAQDMTYTPVPKPIPGPQARPAFRCSMTSRPEY